MVVVVVVGRRWTAATQCHKLCKVVCFSMYLQTWTQRSHSPVVGAPGPTARLRLEASSVQPFLHVGWPTRGVGRATRLPQHAGKPRTCVASLVYCSRQHHQ